jgi:hypothetical protein
MFLRTFAQGISSRNRRNVTAAPAIMLTSMPIAKVEALGFVVNKDNLTKSASAMFCALNYHLASC